MLKFSSMIISSGIIPFFIFDVEFVLMICYSHYGVQIEFMNSELRGGGGVDT